MKHILVEVQHNISNFDLVNHSQILPLAFLLLLVSTIEGNKKCTFAKVVPLVFRKLDVA